MQIHINSSLTPPAYPGERLKDEVFEYVMRELADLRRDTEQHRLHNKLELGITFEGGDHLTFVTCELCVHLKVDVSMRYRKQIRFVNSKLPPSGALRTLLMDCIQFEMAWDAFQYIAEVRLILDTFGPQIRVRVKARQNIIR